MGGRQQTGKTNRERCGVTGGANRTPVCEDVGHIRTPRLPKLTLKVRARSKPSVGELLLELAVGV